jgi:thymidylate kinase
MKVIAANSTTTTVVKPKIVILEGVDRCGKTTMQQEINKQTKYKHIVVDRGPIGFKAYCEIFGRPEKLFRKYNKLEWDLAQLMKDEILVIYIDCATDVLIERCLQTSHEIVDFDLHKSIYEKYFNESPLRKIKVDTTNRHASEIIRDLISEGVL